MTRSLCAVLVSMLVAAPALAEDTGKSKTEVTKADGTKVTVKKKKDIHDDGTGEVKTEVTTENPNTGTETAKRTKVTKDKNDDGSVTTKTKVEVEAKKTR